MRPPQEAREALEMPRTEPEVRCPGCGEEALVEWDPVLRCWTCAVCSRQWSDRVGHERWWWEIGVDLVAERLDAQRALLRRLLSRGRGYRLDSRRRR
jgi:hypothetical protein